MAVVEFEEVGQWLALLEMDHRQEHIAGEGEIEARRCVGDGGGGLPARRWRRVCGGRGFPLTSVREQHESSGIFLPIEAGEEKAGVAFGRGARVFFLRL